MVRWSSWSSSSAAASHRRRRGPTPQPPPRPCGCMDASGASDEHGDGTRHATAHAYSRPRRRRGSPCDVAALKRREGSYARRGHGGVCTRCSMRLDRRSRPHRRPSRLRSHTCARRDLPRARGQCNGAEHGAGVAVCEQEELRELEAKYAELYAPLFSKRKDIVRSDAQHPPSLSPTLLRASPSATPAAPPTISSVYISKSTHPQHTRRTCVAIVRRRGCPQV